MPKADHVSEGGVKLLQEPHLAHFVTIMADGTPQVTPVWVDVTPDGSEILINTALGARVKSRNVERNPNVAVSVVDSQNAWRYITVRGTVVEQDTEHGREHIDFLAKKYVGADKYSFGPPDEQRVVIHIKPHHVVEQGTE